MNNSCNQEVLMNQEEISKLKFIDMFRNKARLSPSESVFIDNLMWSYKRNNRERLPVFEEQLHTFYAIYEKAAFALVNDKLSNSKKKRFRLDLLRPARMFINVLVCLTASIWFLPAVTWDALVNDNMAKDILTGKKWFFS